MKLNQVPSSPHSPCCLSAISRNTPMASRKSAGKNNWDAQQFLLLKELFCLTHLRKNIAKEHQAFGFMILLLRKPFFYRTEMRAVGLWEAAVSLPWPWAITSQSFPEKLGTNSRKVEMVLGRPIFFWEEILVTSNQNEGPAWNSNFNLVDYCIAQLSPRQQSSLTWGEPKNKNKHHFQSHLADSWTNSRKQWYEQNGIQNFKNPEDSLMHFVVPHVNSKLPLPLWVRIPISHFQYSTERSTLGRQKDSIEKCWQRTEKENGFWQIRFYFHYKSKGIDTFYCQQPC